jgi:hypothetical protein
MGETNEINPAPPEIFYFFYPTDENLESEVSYSTTLKKRNKKATDSVFLVFFIGTYVFFILTTFRAYLNRLSTLFVRSA